MIISGNEASGTSLVLTGTGSEVSFVLVIGGNEAAGTLLAMAGTGH